MVPATSISTQLSLEKGRLRAKSAVSVIEPPSTNSWARGRTSPHLSCFSLEGSYSAPAALDKIAKTYATHIPTYQTFLAWLPAVGLAHTSPVQVSRDYGWRPWKEGKTVF